MPWIPSFLSRWKTVLSKKSLSRQLDQELRSHFDLLTEENIRRGMTKNEAQRQARITLGGAAQIQEAYRDQAGLPFLETLAYDLRFGARMLFRNPGFTVVAVLTLALGIGANTAIFSVVNAVLLRPLPYAHPQDLVTLRSNQSWPDLHDIQQQARSLEKIGAFANWQFDLLGNGEPEQVQAALVSLDLFDTLGVAPALGRTFSTADDQPGNARVVVISHGFWQRKLGGDRAAIGRGITLTGNTYTIAGVMPAGFRFPSGDAEIWVPFRAGYPEAAQARGVHMQYSIARLKPGVTRAQAQSELDAIAQGLAKLYPEENRGRRYIALPLQQRVTGNIRPALLVLFGAVGFVLLIASLNFANLLLAKASTRTAEAQVRAALGATPGRLVRQFLTESLLISLLGGAAGLALGSYGIRLLLLLKPQDLPAIAAVNIDSTVLLFTVGVSLLTGCLFGLFPILQVILPRSAAGLKTGKAVSSQSRGTVRLRQAMIVGELAISLMLVCGAGLLIRTLWQLQNVDPGFNAQGVMTARVWLPQDRYAEIGPQNQFYSQLEQQLARQPGVQSAALVTELPLGGNHIPHNFVVAGRAPLAIGTEPEAETNLVSSAYFSTLQIPLRQGRFFTEADREGAPLVAIVNEAMVRQYFAKEDPLGAQLYFARDDKHTHFTIVGVVADVKESGPDQDAEPAIYTPLMQKQEPWRRWAAIVLRANEASTNDVRSNATGSNEAPAALAQTIKNAVWAVNPRIPVNKVGPLSGLLAGSLAPRRFNTVLLAIFAATALALAMIGVYGVVSYTVAQRTQEIGVRIALGASALNVFWMVLKQGLGMTALGIVLGIAGSFAAGRALVSLLFGVSSRDLLTFTATAVLLTIVALLATYIPARRAAKVDPMVALRYD
jgi:putative ABC transport system permease protein